MTCTTRGQARLELDVDADACDEPLWSVFASKHVEALGEAGPGLATAVGYEDLEGRTIQFKLLAISEHCCARFTCHMHEMFGELPVIP